MIYVPVRSKITDKVCIVGEPTNNEKINQGKPIFARFSPKIDSPPFNTMVIVDNVFTGPFTSSEIRHTNSNFYSWLMVENAIPSSHLKPILKIDLRYWALNELFLEGVFEKGGRIASGVELVAVTYSPHSTLILKDGALYKKILGI